MSEVVEQKQAENEVSESQIEFVEDQEEVLDEKPRSIILAMISQLKFGMDLSRVSLPTFVLEPRSITERFTDFMIHSHLLSDALKKDDPVEKMAGISSWLFAGWYPQSRGVKKPYNPTLGEVFRCFWIHPEDGSKTWYIAEQVSHHPPITAFRFENKVQKWHLDANLYTKTKFLGNSVVCLLEGDAHLKVEKTKKKDEASSSSSSSNEQLFEDYSITLPAVYGRGIIVGKLAVEICGELTCKCEDLKLFSRMNFREKSMFYRKYNQVEGEITELNTSEGEDSKKKKKKNPAIITFNGDWTKNLYATDQRKPAKLGDGKPFLLWDKATAKETKRYVAPEQMQQPYESRRVWSNVTKELRQRNTEGASEAKHEIEERQRKLAAERLADGVGWRQRFFHLDRRTQRWKFNYAPDDGDEELVRIKRREELRKKKGKKGEATDDEEEEGKEAEKKGKKDAGEKKSDEAEESGKEFDEAQAEILEELEKEGGEEEAGDKKEGEGEKKGAMKKKGLTVPQQIPREEWPEITPFNCPDARELLLPPSKGKHTEKGKDVDVWVTDFPALPSTLPSPWPAMSMTPSTPTITSEALPSSSSSPSSSPEAVAGTPSAPAPPPSVGDNQWDDKKKEEAPKA
ncbi:putative Oxysterol-binding protein [Monocercomonoides exilis]|uniref:putative Oxysterol-binding protein n=1 Tax=Monocercomonoides exilis TaxID=2049356 RepID=UPI00355A314F|nr:putative Oxysterol-binding protein [Monocercomonoides exilis]|eukprot:MONOS_66.1-p1 / transcript=MONOS_66.1 / gene=MONOS_66 / organism=Monocercomonoides_exilis_PA203 / gene_product=Oxysterol-binding protein / transcript_product=Oxysterol-binding protein / location=Mono_scaffold00001:346136-349133(-) / protein_length=627 / sequence_SO=supercontig / SO=protein_coding / is_pseudo=false